MSVEVIYETHSISTDNEAGIATGWLPGRLSDEGRRLAAELGRRRRDDDLAAVLVSDLTRAVETAHIAFGGTGIPIHYDRRLRECNYGRLNGMPTARLHAERLQHLDTPWPGGQSYHQVVDQTRDLLRDLAADWNGSRLLSSHTRRTGGPSTISCSIETWPIWCSSRSAGRKAGATRCPPAGPVTLPTEGDTAGRLGGWVSGRAWGSAAIAGRSRCCWPRP
jgi:broad specificity phosphatase PhoE